MRPLSVPSKAARVDFGRRQIQLANRRCLRWIAEFVKIVDDCLVHDTDLETHLSHVRAVLTRAREHGITLSVKKFVFGAESVDLCGYQVSEDGWVVDDAKVSAIADFPIPANRTDLRSFMGLVNQVSEFTPKLAELNAPLRGLLKTSNEFTWTANHTLRSTSPRLSLCHRQVWHFISSGLTSGWRPMRLL